eukprot:gb/GECG01012220.1/.p1 GENE.gb/GECG01012220.1/~~gb/GECG01012220.1/.p1  ORF type:complete len:140 (+),score=13.19 gb/GECG01012220.1/:1-420(+)
MKDPVSHSPETSEASSTLSLFHPSLPLPLSATATSSGPATVARRRKFPQGEESPRVSPSSISGSGSTRMKDTISHSPQTYEASSSVSDSSTSGSMSLKDPVSNSPETSKASSTLSLFHPSLPLPLSATATSSGPATVTR